MSYIGEHCIETQEAFNRKLRLVNQYRSGYSLPGGFYVDPEVLEWDRRVVWEAGWLFAAHSCELREPGAYKIVQLLNTTILIWRDLEHRLRAFHNLCRHRGMPLCSEDSGQAETLVCSYHCWSYNSQGNLIRSPGMGLDIDPAENGLLPIHLQEVSGLIFISLASNPPAFEGAAMAISKQLDFHQLHVARIAQTCHYVVEANWKVILENNRECYHCQSNHPEYKSATYDVLRDRQEMQPEMERQLAELRAAWQFSGLSANHFNFSSEMTAEWYRVNRTPLRQGFLTESLDGKPVAPPLANFAATAVGTARITTFPNYWCHANFDHAVSTYLMPISQTSTAVFVSWLVHRDAVEGRDYQLEKLLPFWQRTSEQDWEICRKQQTGLSSPYYKPGRFSSTHEKNLTHLLDWYINCLSDSLTAEANSLE
jgi:Rieske 2Fe-2S family protein